jgi:hypothetical protein
MTYLAPAPRFLVKELRGGMEGAANAITKIPKLLNWSTNKHLAPVVWYLEEEVGLGKDGWTEWRMSSPSIPRCWV